MAVSSHPIGNGNITTYQDPVFLTASGFTCGCALEAAGILTGFKQPYCVFGSFEDIKQKALAHFA